MCKTEDSNTVGIPNCLLFSFMGFREVGEIVVRIVDERRVIIHGSDLVELLWLITCGDGELGQVAGLLVLVRSALDLRF